MLSLGGCRAFGRDDRALWRRSCRQSPCGSRTTDHGFEQLGNPQHQFGRACPSIGGLLRRRCGPSGVTRTLRSVTPSPNGHGRRRALRRSGSGLAVVFGAVADVGLGSMSESFRTCIRRGSVPRRVVRTDSYECRRAARPLTWGAVIRLNLAAMCSRRCVARTLGMPGRLLSARGRLGSGGAAHQVAVRCGVLIDQPDALAMTAL